MSFPQSNRDRAVEMRAAGASIQEIADEFGVSKSTACRWVNPRAAEVARQKAREWKDAHREANRARDREERRSLDYRGRCIECGGPMGTSHREDGTCSGCIASRRVARWERIEAMWAEGLSLAEIGAELGWAAKTLSSELTVMRQEGRNVPHRYDADRVAAMRQARWGVAA
jgi:IS30 family transposase